MFLLYIKCVIMKTYSEGSGHGVCGGGWDGTLILGGAEYLSYFCHKGVVSWRQTCTEWRNNCFWFWTDSDSSESSAGGGVPCLECPGVQCIGPTDHPLCALLVVSQTPPGWPRQEPVVSFVASFLTNYNFNVDSNVTTSRATTP